MEPPFRKDPGYYHRSRTGFQRLGLALAEAIAGAGLNMSFFVAQAVGRKFSAVLGFATEADANTAAGLIKKAAMSKRR